MQIEVHTIETEVLMYETLLIKAGKFFSRARRQSERGLLRIFLITFQQAAVPGRACLHKGQLAKQGNR